MSTKPFTVLVVDDSNQTWLLVSRFLAKLGHTPLQSRSGEEALAAFVSQVPDLILLDVQMPGIDGYETARRVRMLAGARWVPIIFLSASTEEEERIKGLASGGDDYLTKPVSFRLLEAKMQAMQRIAGMQQLLRENAEQLERYHDENEREQRLAKYLMDQLVQTETSLEEGVECWLMPAKQFSGDVLAVAHAPSGALHVILADGTGHGLAAALSVMPVTEVFYSMTKRGFTIPSIARELNRKVKKLLPTGRFVAATLAAINRESHTIEIWNGGNPAALFVCHEGDSPRVWPSAHPALGILNNEEFSDRTESFLWGKPGQLYMCSDGLLEAEDPAGDGFGSERLQRILSETPPESRFGRVRTEVTAHLDGQPAHDDVSLIAVTCPQARRMKTSVTQEISRATNTPDASPISLSEHWRISVRLSAAELKTVDILPFLMGWVDQVNLHSEHRGQVFLILSELFNNALDHGILQLDSALKADPEDGFERYLSERAARLAALDSGFVEIEIAPSWRLEGEALELCVKDSGNGFDHERMLKVDISASTAKSGRGIALLQNLCSKVTYLGKGNEVVAYYRLT